MYCCHMSNMSNMSSWKGDFCTYLIGQIFGGHNFSADKLFCTHQNFRQFCPTKFFIGFLFSVCLQEKYILIRVLYWFDLFWISTYSYKIFRRTKFSEVSQIFGIFVRRYFCPIRYVCDMSFCSCGSMRLHL